MKRPILVALSAVILGVGAPLALAVSVAGLSVAAASTSTTVVVTSTDLVTGTPSPGQFVVINQSGGSGSVGMVFGPGTPPLGLGSLQLTVIGSGDHWSVYNYDHMGTPLSAITALSYSTYTDNTTTAPTLQMEINPGNTTGTDAGVTYSTLNFEPYLNSGEQALAANTWQTWNVLSGKVWGTHLTGAPMSSPISWTSFLATYPNATIKYGFGVNVGSGWSAMTGETDALTIGTATATTTYNFEPGAGNRPFKSAGSGTESSLSTSGCQNTSPYDCTVQSTGTAISSHLGIGPYVSTLTVQWGSATSNGGGGYCAPADGTGTLTAANGDTLTQYEVGTVCEVGPTSLNAPHTFTGIFWDTGGTGRFADAIGGGTVTGGDDGTGNSYYSETGTIGY